MKEIEYNDAIRAHNLKYGFKELWHQCQFDDMMLQDYPHEVSEDAMEEMGQFHEAVHLIYTRMRGLYETFDEIETKDEQRQMARMKSVPVGKTGCSLF